MKRKLMKLFFRSFDDNLNQQEQRLLDGALSRSKELQSEKDSITQLRQMISGNGADSFQPFFAQRVIERLNHHSSSQDTILDLQKFYDSLLWSFRRVTIAGAMLALVMLVYNLGIPDSTGLFNSMSWSDISLQQILNISLF